MKRIHNLRRNIVGKDIQAYPDDGEIKKIRATRKKVRELNRQRERLQQEGLLPPDR